MAEHKIEELAKDVAELKSFASQSTRQRSKDLFAIEIRKLDTELSKLRSEIPAATTPTTPTATVVPAAAPKRYQAELTQYAFDQSDKFVKLFVTLDGVEKCAEDNVRVVFTDSSITLTVIDLNNKDHQLKINNLLEPIDVPRSHRKLKPGMVVIYAKKVSEGKTWSDLTVIERRVRDMKSAALEPKKDAAAAADPSGGLMDIMQKMYNSGDAEMKKMISKAWTEGEEKRRAGGAL